MVVKAPLGGTKRHHGNNDSNSNKELVHSKNLNLPLSDLQSVTMSPSLARWKEGEKWID
jgi:hypothetical protein